MKEIRRLVLAALSAAYLAGSPARAAAARPEAEIERIVRDYLAHAGELAANERFWAHDLIYTDSLGGRSGRKDVLESVAAAAASPGGKRFTHEAKDMRIRRYGDIAVVAFTLFARVTGGPATATRTHMITGVLHRERGTWRAVAWQSTDPQR